jgi:hypothetical protein
LLSKAALAQAPKSSNAASTLSLRIGSGFALRRMWSVSNAVMHKTRNGVLGLADMHSDSPRTMLLTAIKIDAITV